MHGPRREFGRAPRLLVSVKGLNGAIVGPDEWAMHRQVVDLIRAQAGDETFDRLGNDGIPAALDGAVACALGGSWNYHSPYV